MAIGWERFGTRARKVALHECLAERYVCHVWCPDEIRRLAAFDSVLSEFVPVLDEDDVVRWFVEPNDWLSGECPARRAGTDPEAVRQAARADRFVARG